MGIITQNLTQDLVKELFEYNGTNLTKKIKGRRKRVVAGSLRDGYRLIQINGRKYYASRLVWLWHYGEEPDGLIDHINHRRDDNSIDNLRVVDASANAKNRTRHPKQQIHPGVFWYEKTGKWHVSIGHKGRQIHLGYFKDLDQALSMRLCAESHYDYHTNHGGLNA